MRDLVSSAASYCEKRRAMLLLDAPKPWTTKDKARDGFNDLDNDAVGTRSRNVGAVLPASAPTQIRFATVRSKTFAACGAVAGVFARTDAQDRGVWKAPAGFNATLVGVPQLSVQLTDPENGELNPLGVNCLRNFPVYSNIGWGARTLDGEDDCLRMEVRAGATDHAVHRGESLSRAPSGWCSSPTTSRYGRRSGSTSAPSCMTFSARARSRAVAPRSLFREVRQRDDTANDIDIGIVNIEVGFAPLKPAEFVVKFSKCTRWRPE